MDPQKPIIHESVVKVPPPSHRSSRISCPPERYMGMLTKKVKKIFFMGDKDHDDDPNIFDKMMSNIDFKKWLDVMKSEIDSMHLN